MAKQRARPKPTRSVNAEIAALKAALETCSAHIERLRRDNDTHITRMAAMQAEIDHLLTIVGRDS